MGIGTLLRRITKHVKDQNWFAVGVDFVIVVVGVFIGIQVANWNDAQNERIDTSSAFERLHEDFELILGQTERSLSRHETYIKAAARVIEGTRSGEYSEETLFEDLALIGDFSVPSGPSATYAELVAAGRIKLIRNEELRRRLKTYDDYVTLVRSDYRVFTDSLVEANSVLMRAQTVEVTGVPNPDIGDVVKVIDVDRVLLANELEIRTQLQIAYGVQNNIYAVLVRNRGEILEIIEMIEAELAS